MKYSNLQYFMAALIFFSGVALIFSALAFAVWISIHFSVIGGVAVGGAVLFGTGIIGLILTIK